MIPTADTIRPKVGFEHKRDPELIDRVIEMKRRTRYFAGEGFCVAPRHEVHQ